MKETIVLYPAPALGHLVSMVELGKLILQHHSHYSITILIPTTPWEDGTTISSYINKIKLPLPFHFHHLPTPNLSISPNSNTQTRVANAFEFMRSNVPNVLHALKTISLTSTIPSLITSSVQDSYDPNIPTYYYFTSCASTLATFLYFPFLHTQTTKSFKDLPSTVFHIPGLPPITASHLPEPILDRDHQAYHDFLNFGACLPKSNGIIVNTFESLEPRAIKAITDGDCTSPILTPPIYCIGPVIADAEDRIGNSSNSLDCLTWLNTQPSKSVVFLCFGSKGAHSTSQLREIAIGLERSNQRFLWVVKNPPPNTSEEPNLELLLPNGFLERTKEMGLVVKSWAPQAAVLRHESVGGFVTHCGWNSVVEAVSAGVPMVAWPLYAEQRLNSVVLVGEMKVGIAIAIDDDGWVRGDEIERCLRELMGSRKGEEVRKRSEEMRVMASEAWMVGGGGGGGGSSLATFSNLVASWSSNHSKG
ncbi:hypothetical protein ACSBR2_034122 [Camellia fascicularis]